MTVAAAIDPVALFLLGLLVVALMLFQRWQDSGDRSAYAIGALAAVATPLVATFYLVWSYLEDPFFAQGGWRHQATGWGIVVFALPFLFFAWRPVVVTGFFALASQNRIRRLYHSLDTSWQYALSTLIVGQLVLIVWRSVEKMAWG